MEKLEFAGKYSFKNIPTPGKLEYTKQLVFSLEKLLRRMRWRAFYYLQLGESSYEERNDSDTNENEDEHIENSRFCSLFKCRAKPPFIDTMQHIR